MNNKDNLAANSKAPNTSTKTDGLNKLEQDIYKMPKDLEGVDGSEADSTESEVMSTELNDSENSSNDRPKHDSIIRKALENPIVAKEFFEMHLPKEIKAMFSPHTLKMEKERVLPNKCVNFSKGLDSIFKFY